MQKVIDGRRWLQGFLGAGAVALFAVVLATQGGYKAFATAAYLCMATGFFWKGGRRTHALLMASAMIMDVALVLVLQIERGAAQAAAGPGLSLVQQVHVACSACAVLLYAPMAVLGRRRSSWHRIAGEGTFFLRTAGFITMFGM